MYDHVPENVINGVKISVIDLPKLQKSKETVDSPVQTLPKNIAGKDKLKLKQKKDFTPNRFVLFTAELIGTALLLFLGCMGCITEVDNSPVPHHLSGITFGLVVMMIIQIFGHISGAHLNPAVTIATVYLGYLKPVVAVIYFIAQFTGAIIGFGLLKILVPLEFVATEMYDPITNSTVHKTGLCSTLPHEKTTTLQAVAIEAIITTVLILVCCSVWDRRNAAKADSVPLRFGLIIAVISMAAGPFTGASMNTVRTFAPALLNGDWDRQWIYWVGPTLGGIVGAGLYKYLYSIPDEEPEIEEMKLQERLEDTPLNNIDKV